MARNKDSKRQVSPMDGEPTVIEVETATDDQMAEAKPGHSLPLVYAIVGVIVALAVGLVIGKFALGGAGGGLSGKTSLSEGELDSQIASYTYEGQSHQVTARQVMEATSGVESSKQDDGSYTYPSASDVLSYAQNQVLNAAVQKEGIEVTDEDMKTYAQDTLGSDDYAELASNYGMTEDAVKTIVRESAGVKQLYDKIVGDQSDVTMPDAPEAPAEGEEDTPSATYGEYIVNLLGDEWDAEKGTWAREDGPYYAAMSDMEFSADSATYNQAMTAYYVAYQAYSESASDASATWTNYVNGLLANASITMGEMVS